MTCSLPVARILRHAYDGARVVIYIRWSLRSESIFEVSFVLGHMLPLHDYLHLKPFDLSFMLPCGVALDLVVESRSNHSCARGQIAPLTLFFRQPCSNRPVISIPCSSSHIGASRSFRIAAPLCFWSGSVMSMHERSSRALDFQPVKERILLQVEHEVSFCTEGS